MFKLYHMLREKLKQHLAKDELEELRRWKIYHREYRVYLCEFKDISLVLDNLEIHVKGDRGLNICRPPSTTGPWDLCGLRYNIRFKRGGVIQAEPIEPKSKI